MIFVTSVIISVRHYNMLHNYLNPINTSKVRYLCNKQ